MTDQPLVPFHPPTETLQSLGIVLPSFPLLEAFLLLVFALWVLYTLVVVYHWLRYSHASLLAFPAIFVHFAISYMLMSYALVGRLFL